MGPYDELGNDIGYHPILDRIYGPKELIDPFETEKGSTEEAK